MAWLSAVPVVVSSESPRQAEFASCIEDQIADEEVESVSELIQEFAEVTTRRGAWTESLPPRGVVGPLPYFHWVKDAAFAEAMLPWLFLHAALQAMVITPV
eukprot:TRINITY_DN27491_c0_g1_i4.p2 TRINITY_DN27491_c0_g1~~TRINITY_DN27491_c0_g1_i4.p2  ORF type:complete len:101 (-),score=11.21 TRINITY_DN27491_c0_g1_i4:235-537(-)